MEDKKKEDIISVGGKKLSVKTVVALGITGILLVAISGFWGETKTAVVTPETGDTEMARYISETEDRVEELLTSISEVGEAKIMLTLESGNEYVYAKDQKLSANNPEIITESRYILVDSTSGRQALVVQQLAPKIKGVVVVCQGGDNPIVKQRISEVLSTSLGISYLQISVQKLAV